MPQIGFLNNLPICSASVGVEDDDDEASAGADANNALPNCNVDRTVFSRFAIKAKRCRFVKGRLNFGLNIIGSGSLSKSETENCNKVPRPERNST